MKKFLIAILVAGAWLTTAQAQLVCYRTYYSYPAYAYPYYPAPAYYSYEYQRPNYAVGGTLFGALAGGLIGNSIHHQGWEGAGIGAAAGLLFGSLAEHSARARERVYFAPPPVYGVPEASTANTAPAVPPAPQVPEPTTSTFTANSSMSSANSLFGR
ncbi:MAG TPA: YMGG-like glycine zipper-containing protein [Bacillota bacterium]|nr:YMGG-like glycine zipper-containing protein [Bacillota bacterium]